MVEAVVVVVVLVCVLCVCVCVCVSVHACYLQPSLVVAGGGVEPPPEPLPSLLVLRLEPWHPLWPFHHRLPCRAVVQH